MKLNISTYCIIENGIVSIDGKKIYDGDSLDEEFLKGLYGFLEMNYSKFYKMDNLSKLGVLGVELLKRSCKDLDEVGDESVGIVFQSEKGCLESDIEHQSRLSVQSPSPAIFVYTLSNIVIGEISIRNKWFGESIFFIEKESELSTLISYTKSLILTGKSEVCILGLVESYKSQHLLKMAVVLPGNVGENELNEINLKNIFRI